MLQLDPGADSGSSMVPWHLSDPDLELSRIAVTDADWQAMQLSDQEFAGMVPSLDEDLAMSDADWIRLRLSQSTLIRFREDLMRRLGAGPQDLTWLSREIERREHGHTRAKTHANRTQTDQG